MSSMFELKIGDADVMAFESALAARLPNPGSLLQAVGGQRYLLSGDVAKALFPGSSTAQIRAGLLEAGAGEIRMVKGAKGFARLATRSEPAFVTRFMAAAPAPAVGALDWHLTEVRLPDAWDFLGGVANPVWASIRVGHIDTGYSEQPALGPWANGASQVIRTDLDANFFNAPNEDPLSALEPGHGDGFPFHGTRTLCTLAGRDANAPQRPFFGSAPGVEVVPIRDTNSIVVDDQQPGVCDGIRHAVNKGCRVITISQGITLLPMPCVQKALNEAYEQGVIVVAAAGQHSPFFVFAPGRLRHAIAVGGTTPGLNVWLPSCAGPQVAISAPAEPIRVASTKFTNKYEYLYGESNGTSYATPLVAGTAALWLARWGAELDTRYPEKWQRVAAFRRVLQQSAQVPTGWDTQRNGAGVLDALATIEADLPDRSTLVPE
jgi:subtilisin family serine protease